MRLKGEDPNDQDAFNAPDSFITSKLWKKIIILLAGIGMNFIVARVIFTTIFTIGTQPMSVLPANTVASQTNSYLMPTIDFLQAE